MEKYLFTEIHDLLLDLLTDFSSDRDAVAILYKYKGNIRRILDTYDSIQKFFTLVLDNFAKIKSFDALAKRIQEYIAEIKALIAEHYDCMYGIQALIQTLPSHHKYADLLKTSVISAEIDLIQIILEIYHALNNKETAKMKAGIAQLINFFDKYNNVVLQEMQLSRTKLEALAGKVEVWDSYPEDIRTLVQQIVVISGKIIKLFE